MLNHLRSVAAGFRIGASTAYRYIGEPVDLVAALAPTFADAARTGAAKAHMILDGTLLPIDRIKADRPCYCGKHHRHGMNVHVVAAPTGRLIWASPALPGAVHDIKAARTHGIIAAMAEAKATVFADKAYRGARGTARTPLWAGACRAD